MKASRQRIKSNWTSLVILFLAPIAVHAAEPSDAINVRPFEVVIKKVSDTQRVFLFDLTKGNKPKTSRIILVRTLAGDKNLIACRVIKTYRGTMFAGIRTRNYIDVSDVPTDVPLFAIEKKDIGGMDPLPPRQEVEKDLRDVEGGMDLIPDAYSYDPELDAGNSPLREVPVTTNERVSVRVVERFDLYDHSLTLSFSFLRALSPTDGSNYYTGGGIRYAYTFSRSLFFSGLEYPGAKQDSMSVEVSVFAYKVLGYDNPGGSPEDTYSVMPVTANLRYNLHFSPELSAFVWAGLMKNFVVTSSNATDNGLSNLGAFLPAFGVGLHYMMGPHWYLRGDLGYDLFGLGVELRF